MSGALIPSPYPMTGPGPKLVDAEVGRRSGKRTFTYDLPDPSAPMSVMLASANGTSESRRARTDTAMRVFRQQPLPRWQDLAILE